MWKILIVTVLPLLAITQAFYVVPEDEIIKNYRSARAALTPEQHEFLMELMAADDAIIDTASRGIVDDILQAISGTGGNIRVNVIGGSPQQPQQQQPQQQVSQQQQPSVNLINPSFTVVGSTQEKTLLNNTDANTIAAMAIASAISGTAPPMSMPMADISSPVSSPSAGSSSSGVPSTSSPKQTITIGLGSLAGTVSNAVPQQQQQQQQMQSNVTTIGGNNNHLFQTISQVIRNSNSRNVTGIVDESLRIATPAPIREFVTGLLNVVYCNGIRRLLGRC